MSDFRATIEASGLRPRDVSPDGKWHRCATDDKPRKRNGAYCLALDGLRGWFKNWATDVNLNDWAGTDTRSATKRVFDEANSRRQRERDRAYRVQSIRSARAFWQASRPLNRPHAYIERKGLSPLGCSALRTNDGLLVVPVMLGDALVSVQTIAVDGTKRFWPGAPVKAGALVLDRPRAAVTCVVEGLATGLAVYQSMPKARVIVAFDAGNLLPVVSRIRPTGSVVICADHDHKTLALRGINPGLNKARSASELIGCGVAHPQGIEGTDWCDYLAEVGEGAARKLERAVLAQARFVMS